MRRPQRGPKHEFPIAPVIEALKKVSVPHVRGNRDQQMFCPFHENTHTPAGSVSEFLFHCFGCGASYDAIKLVREEEDLDYEGAVARCKEITGSAGGGVPRRTGWGHRSLLGRSED